MNAITAEKMVLALIGGVTFLIVALLFSILGVMLAKGLPAMHSGFLFDASRDFGRSGGIFYQLTGTDRKSVV